MHTQPNFSAVKGVFIAFTIALATFLSFLCLHFFFVAFEPRFGFFGGLALALGGVLVLDLGAWIWKANIKASESDSQEFIAFWLAVADIGFALLAGAYHLLQLIGIAGLPAWMGQFVGVVLVVALVANVAALFAYQLASPAAAQARADRFAQRLYLERLNEQKQQRILAAADADAAEVARVQTDAFRARFRNAEAAGVGDMPPHSLNARITQSAALDGEEVAEDFTHAPRQ